MPNGSSSMVRMGTRTLIRPILPDDSEWAFRTCVLTDVGYHWRLHGEVPVFERFLNLLLQHAKCTFVICTTDDQPARIGMVQLWNYDGFAETGHITAFLDPAFVGRAWPVEGFLLFIDYVFATYRLRKLYVEMLDTELHRLGNTAERFLTREGVLREHRYINGTLVDLHLFALFRDQAVDMITALDPVGGTYLLTGAT